MDRNSPHHSWCTWLFPFTHPFPLDLIFDLSHILVSSLQSGCCSECTSTATSSSPSSSARLSVFSLLVGTLAWASSQREQAQAIVASRARRCALIGGCVFNL